MQARLASGGGGVLKAASGEMFNRAETLTNLAHTLPQTLLDVSFGTARGCFKFRVAGCRAVGHQSSVLGFRVLPR